MHATPRDDPHTAVLLCRPQPRAVWSVIDNAENALRKMSEQLVGCTREVLERQCAAVLRRRTVVNACRILTTCNGSGSRVSVLRLSRALATLKTAHPHPACAAGRTNACVCECACTSVRA
eukprot:6188172-Pleurochrysis_carterae.AAC.4